MRCGEGEVLTLSVLQGLFGPEHAKCYCFKKPNVLQGRQLKLFIPLSFVDKKHQDFVFVQNCPGLKGVAVFN